MTSCNFILLLKAVSKCTHAEGWSFGMGFGGLHFISDSVKLLGFLPLLRHMNIPEEGARCHGAGVAEVVWNWEPMSGLLQECRQPLLDYSSCARKI
ncbi:hypothetical protein LEMLEM_LOCUS21676 [Lemmus lemmus]